MKNSTPSETAADELAACCDHDYPSRANDLLQVDFQADHEEHEDQAELGDDLDRLLRLDPSHPEWSDKEPGQQIGQYQRLPGKMGGQSEAPGKQDGQRNIANKFVHALSRSAESRHHLLAARLMLQAGDKWSDECP